LSGWIDFGIQADDGLVVWRAGVHLAGEPADGGVMGGAVFDQGVEGDKVFSCERVPELAPLVFLDAQWGDVDEFFFAVLVLFPEADDDEEGFVDVELAQCIAQIDSGAPLGDLGVDGDVAVGGVDVSGDVPLAGVGGPVAVEKGVVDPVFKHQSVVLHFAGGEVRPKSLRAENDEQRTENRASNRHLFNLARLSRERNAHQMVLENALSSGILRG